MNSVKPRPIAWTDSRARPRAFSSTLAAAGHKSTATSAVFTDRQRGSASPAKDSSRMSRMRALACGCRDR